jgi:hypothetical protein
MFSFSLNNFVFTIIGSIIIILAGHYLWIYLRDKYTVKKTKDIVNVQVEKYKKIVAELQETIDSRSQNTEFLNDDEKDAMDKDLAAFASSLCNEGTLGSPVPPPSLQEL